MSGYPHLPPPPPQYPPPHAQINPRSRTTKTRSGTPIRCYRPPPPPPPPHGAPPRGPPPSLPYGAPPFATGEPPELQPKALLGPFTDVAQIKKVRGWPPLCFHRIRKRPARRGTISPRASEQKDLTLVPWRAANRCAGCSPRVLLCHLQSPLRSVLRVLRFCAFYMSCLRVASGGETSRCSRSAEASPGDQR